jgi:2-phospho-L-lactate guanylyltransferase
MQHRRSAFSILNISIFNCYMIAAIVPVKSLTTAKGRLAGFLSPPERRALVQAMLHDVLAALLATRAIDRVGVISPDPGVLAQAGALGAEPLADHTPDLNAALAQAARHYLAAGASAALLLHADVPLITPAEIEQLIAARHEPRGALLAPSRDGGTNALLAWPPLALPLHFGANSLALHRAAAREHGVSLRLFHRPGLELDIDRPDDLWLLAETAGSSAAQQLARELNVYERMAYV